MYTVLIGDVWSRGFKEAVLVVATTPDQKICGNTHDQSLNNADIEIDWYLTNRKALATLCSVVKCGVYS